MEENKKCNILEKIVSFQKEMNKSNVDEISNLESKFQELKRIIANTGEEKNYILAMTFIGQKLEDFQKEKLHMDDINQLENDRKDLETKVLDIHIPVIKNPGSRFDELRKDAAKLEESINKHCDNCYAIANIRQAIHDIKVKIESLDEDNKMCLGWLGATTSLSVASIGVAFIPIVGLPIAAVMNAAPYLGKLTHRLVVSHKRKNKFK